MEEGEAYQGGFSIRTRSEKVGVIMRQEMLISCILICTYEEKTFDCTLPLLLLRHSNAGIKLAYH